MELRLTYDATTDIAYLVMAPTGPSDVLGPTLLLENDREFAGAVSADFTVADGRLGGLEFRDASACLPPAWLVAAERIDGEHLGRRMEERFALRDPTTPIGLAIAATVVDDECCTCSCECPREPAWPDDRCARVPGGPALGRIRGMTDQSRNNHRRCHRA